MTVTTARPVDASWVRQTLELDEFQLGAIRRISNLSRQLPGDWSGMMGSELVLAENFSALRFQLNYMGYALALAHVHRLPAAPGVFKKPFENIITQMMHPDTWLYWTHASTGMGPFNKDLGPQPMEYDPVAKDNIMYSAYLQSLALMYHYVFRDDRYAMEGGLRLRLNTMFWHEGGFTFDYNEKTLNSHIYWQMAEQGFLGVACEPGCIFQICNQPAIIGFRMHDLVYGGNMAEHAQAGYVKAWEEFGLLDATGSFQTLVLANSRTPVTIPHPEMNFWLMALLHSWHPAFVEEHYPRLIQPLLLEGPNGTKWIKPDLRPIPGAEEHWLSPILHPWAACAASEVGDSQNLDGLLGYADLMLNPAWQDGGYYYKRRDAAFDEAGFYIGVDPMAGNALLHYARLNVKDGLRKLYDGPLDDSHFEQPALIGLPDDLDIRRAIYDPGRRALALTLGAFRARRTIRLDIRMPAGVEMPEVDRDGNQFTGAIERTAEGLTIVLDHHDRTTLVLQW